MKIPDLPPPPSGLQRLACHAGPPRHLLTSLGSSGLIHVTAGVLVTISLGVYSARPYAPARGVNSIEISASFATPDNTLQEEPAPRPVEIQVAAATVRRPPLQARAVPISRQGQRPPALDDDLADFDTAAVLSPQPEKSAASPRTVARPDVPIDESRPHPLPKRVTARIEITDSDVPRASIASVATRQSAGARTNVPARTSFNPRPQYPAEALAARLSGRVVLRATIAADGRVTSVSVDRSSGVTILDRAALDAVRQWKFEPARRLGMPVATEVTIPMRFRIEEPL